MARPKKPEGERISDIAPTAVRLPVDLREELAREAAVKGISLTQEIIARLRSTFPQPGLARVVAGDGQQPRVEFTAMSGSQRALLMHFSGMPAEKQLALLTLLKR